MTLAPGGFDGSHHEQSSRARARPLLRRCCLRGSDDPRRRARDDGSGAATANKKTPSKKTPAKNDTTAPEADPASATGAPAKAPATTPTTPARHHQLLGPGPGCVLRLLQSGERRNARAGGQHLRPVRMRRRPVHVGLRCQLLHRHRARRCLLLVPPGDVRAGRSRRVHVGVVQGRSPVRPAVQVNGPEAPSSRSALQAGGRSDAFGRELPGCSSVAARSAFRCSSS